MPVRAHTASDYLQTPEDVAAYLNAAAEECEGDPRLLMKALQNVAAAQRAVAATAHSAEVTVGGTVMNAPLGPSILEILE